MQNGEMRQRSIFKSVNKKEKQKFTAWILQNVWWLSEADRIYMTSFPFLEIEMRNNSRGCITENTSQMKAIFIVWSHDEYVGLISRLSVAVSLSMAKEPTLQKVELGQNKKVQCRDWNPCVFRLSPEQGLLYFFKSMWRDFFAQLPSICLFVQIQKNSNLNCLYAVAEAIPVLLIFAWGNRHHANKRLPANFRRLAWYHESYLGLRGLMLVEVPFGGENDGETGEYIY